MWHFPTGIDLSVAANAFPYNTRPTDCRANRKFRFHAHVGPTSQYGHKYYREVYDRSYNV